MEKDELMGNLITMFQGDKGDRKMAKQILINNIEIFSKKDLINMVTTLRDKNPRQPIIPKEWNVMYTGQINKI